MFDMPAPLANRFLHLQVEPDFDSFKAYAIENDIHEQAIAFLSFRPTLLHKLDPQQPAWASPRFWVMASTLHHSLFRECLRDTQKWLWEDIFLIIYLRLFDRNIHEVLSRCCHSND